MDSDWSLKLPLVLPAGAVVEGWYSDPVLRSVLVAYRVNGTLLSKEFTREEILNASELPRFSE